MREADRFCGAVSVTAAWKTGPEHLREGTSSQDAFAVFQTDRAVVIAAADGLGSARRSEIGSARAVRIAVQKTVEYLLGPEQPRRGARSLMVEILRDWNEAVESDSKGHASTLLVFGCTPRRRLAAQIGDGLMLFLHRGSERRVRPFVTLEKAYLNLTDSLASDDALSRFHAEVVEGAIEDEIEAVMLVTDGIADDLSDPERYLRDVVARARVAGPAASLTLNQHLENWPTPGHFDDKTLVLLDLGSREGQEKEYANLGEGEDTGTYGGGKPLTVRDSRQNPGEPEVCKLDAEAEGGATRRTDVARESRTASDDTERGD